MRISWIKLLVVCCVFSNMVGAGVRQAFADFVPKGEAAENVTNIAECLGYVRSHNKRAVLVRMKAFITLVDQGRKLIVLQDDSGAMAIYTSLADMKRKTGERVLLEGDDINPYVQSFPRYPDEPSNRDFVNSFEEPVNNKDYFLSRIRGYLHPPVTGQYTFWIASDDAGEFYLSTDASPDRMQRIAYNNFGDSTRPGDWTHYATQQSIPITLTAGETYYVEALHAQSSGSNSMAVAWQGPGIERSVIDGRYLTPWVGHSAGAGWAADIEFPITGLFREQWFNFFVRDFDELRPQSPDESFIRIHSLKLTEVGSGKMPVPRQVDDENGLNAVPNLERVNLEGDVTFVGKSGDLSQLELKLGSSTMAVRVMDSMGLSTDPLMDSHVQVQGVLEHDYDSPDGLSGTTIWVPDCQHITFQHSVENIAEPLRRVSICDIEPSNPNMTWGRRVRVRARIISQTTNGYVVLRGDDNYEAFCSRDGTNWMALGTPVEIGMNNLVQAGLAVAAHSDTELDLATVRFDHLEGLGAKYEGTDIGNPKQTGGFEVRNGVITVRGGGRGFRMNNDQQYYVHQAPDGDTISAQLIDLPQMVRAQAGLMYRESMDRRASYAAVLFAPASGPMFQYRQAYGADSSAFAAIPEYRHFQWLKLARHESLLLARGSPAPEISTNDEVEVSGMITWQEGTPILEKTTFEIARMDIPMSQTNVSQSQPGISIAKFVMRAEHPVEPYLYHGIEAPKLTGIVTFCGKYQGTQTMFIQDGEGDGIQMGWSDTNAEPDFAVGQLVEVSGHAHIRRFPVLLEPNNIIVKGWGTLPAPVPYSPALFEQEDGPVRWVEASGVVRSQGTNGLLSLMTQYGVLSVWVGHWHPGDGRYVDALVRARGPLLINSTGNACLLVPSPDYVEMQEHPPADPFSVPSFSIAKLAALVAKPEWQRRMKTTGVVTCCLPNGFYIQDDTGGAYVETAKGTSYHAGDQVEVVGFPDSEQFTFQLKEAEIRKIGQGRLPKPIRLSPDEFAKKKRSGKLVTLDAMLLDEREKQGEILLTLQIGTTVFETAGVTLDTEPLPEIPVGSRVSVTGVCEIDQLASRADIVELQATQAMTALKIWLPSVGDVALLEKPSWWTPKRLICMGGITAAGFLVALIWVRLLRRRIAERTRQLQATMARLEKETHISAVLAERDRLAGEIHDSLEQSLTAVMLQLDAANRQMGQPSEARKFLNMARNMAEFTRAEIQHTVWDLRSPLLTNADLCTALKHVTRQISSGFPEVNVEIVGSPRALPTSTEHHMLRIAQEGITNAIKHANARSIKVALEYTDSAVCLSITDDGRGFIAEAENKTGESGHFGLQGIRSRSKRIKAKLEIASRLGAGTVVTVQMNFNNAHPAGLSRKEE